MAIDVMDTSFTLGSAHIEFLETPLALIHIPLELYSQFIQPFIQLLLLPTAAADGYHPTATNGPGLENTFANISVTPIECSIVCSRQISDALFTPILESLPPAHRDAVLITQDDYVVMQVDGEGIEAGQRVLELTAPLAMAGISIFFVTTYFSDYILVPLRAKAKVINALEAQGFAFESSDSTTSLRHRAQPSYSSFDLADLSMSVPSAPGTPPPATVAELQTRTFATLKKSNVVPRIDTSIRLVQCAARRSDTGFSSSGAAALNAALSDRLNLALVKCLLEKPKFLSITLTDTEPASILLEHRFLPKFDTSADAHNHNANAQESLLLGSQTAILNPIILDLRSLPLDSTGIVCGVAGRLVGGTKMGWMEAVEMSYLGTARAGTVMVAEEDAERAVGALKGWEGAESEGGGGHGGGAGGGAAGGGGYGFNGAVLGRAGRDGVDVSPKSAVEPVDIPR